MAIARSSSLAEVTFAALRVQLDQVHDRWRDALTRRNVYQQTVHELSTLSDRDLADLGISRCDIRRLAKETAYGE